VITPLSPAQLSRYFARIGYGGDTTPSLTTLRGLHRAHLLSIPYENLDIHFGVPLTLDPGRMFAKLVDERRGGWCYEMNGLFAYVLETLGFDVRRVSGTVGRKEHGWRAQGNHLVLIVMLDRPWIADVGFGDGFLNPLPLEPGTYSQSFLRYRVSREGPRWRVDNHQYGSDGFDFTLTARTLDAFAVQCRELQTSPDSAFVRTTVCERFTREGLVILRGATLKEITADGVTSRVLQDATEFTNTLRERFGLDLPAGAADLWPRVWSRHLAWEAEQAAPVEARTT
jgi:N-hydroxyarylamine O-acetyltransferase